VLRLCGLVWSEIGKRFGEGCGGCAIAWWVFGRVFTGEMERWCRVSSWPLDTRIEGLCVVWLRTLVFCSAVALLFCSFPIGSWERC